jgi:hypothetical protein
MTLRWPVALMGLLGLSLCWLALASTPEEDAPGELAPVFKATIPARLRDGLEMVEIRQRCKGCSPWRYIDYYDNNAQQATHRAKVTVQAGYTAMYSYPGTQYFANVKIEQSAPGSYEADRSAVTDGLRHECQRKKERVASYLASHPEVREKVEAQLQQGKEAIEFEEGSYRGVQYASCTENVIKLISSTPSQLQIFVPRHQVVVTAYLLRQSNSKFHTTEEFLRMRRDFIEGYIDFLAAAGAS